VMCRDFFKSPNNALQWTSSEKSAHIIISGAKVLELIGDRPSRISGSSHKANWSTSFAEGEFCKTRDRLKGWRGFCSTALRVGNSIPRMSLNSARVPELQLNFFFYFVVSSNISAISSIVKSAHLS